MKRKLWIMLVLAVLAAALCCGASLADNDYVLESEHPYPDDADLTWEYTHPTDADFLKVTFSEDTKTEYYYDYIYLTDETDTTLQYTGTELAGKDIYLQGRSFTIRLTSNSFNNAYGFAITSVVAANESEYLNAPFIDGTCGDNLTWKLNRKGVLTISGTGPMEDGYWEEYHPDWYGYRESISTVIIEDGVTTISSYAFYNMASVTDVTIPASVTKIGYYAFKGCTSLTVITISDGVTYIGIYAFEDCASLTSITIPASITTIDHDAFNNCAAMTGVTFLNPITFIGKNVFQDCADGLILYGWNPSTAKTYAMANGINFESLGDTTIEDATGTCGDHLTWTLNYASGVLTITGTGTMDDYSEDNPSWNDIIDYIISIEIEDGVTSIGAYAFYGCNSLRSIMIPDSITSIGIGAFYYCRGLISITIPDSVSSIGNGAFMYCESLTSVIIPSGITSIGNSVFKSCYSLTGITIPDSVTAIGDAAFDYCESLTGVIFPSGVTSIGRYAFSDCHQLTSVTLPSSVTSIGDGAFYKCFCLTSVSLQAGVISIGDGAFYCCNNLTSIVIPDSVTSIGTYAFEGCSELASATILNPACVIGDSSYDVFISCAPGFMLYGYSGSTAETYADAAGISFEVIPNGSCGDNVYWLLNVSSGVMTISGTGPMVDYSGREAPWYDHRTDIASVVIEDGVTTIGSYAFYDCDQIGHVIIPDSVTAIKGYAFGNCSAIQQISLSANVSGIEANAFFGCRALTQITVAADNTAYCSVDGVLFNHDMWLLLCYPAGKPESSYTVPDSVTNIYNAAFAYSTALESIALNSSLGEIATTAFRSCTGLTSIVIPDQVQTIGLGAFYGCTSLTYAEIGSGVTSMRNNIFQNCTALQTVLFRGSAPAIGGNVFKDCTLTAYYPAGDATWTDDKKQDYGGLVTWIDNSCGDNVTWAFNPVAGTLTISGTGPMADYSSVSSQPWYSYHTDIASVCIGSSVTSIGDTAFANCTGLTGITIPTGIVHIGNNAFANCTGLIGITIPGGVTSIDYNTFHGCTNLTSATILHPDCTIGDSDYDVFKDCASTFTLRGWPGSTAEAYAQAAGHTFETLPLLALPANLTTIEEDAFQGISALGVRIPSSVTSISGNPFAGSSVRYILGVSGTLAQTFAANNGYTFIPWSN